jgi:haloalkane dehalogenase
LIRRRLEVAGAECSLWEAGAGEPVLYLHGFPTSGYLWRKVIKEVAGDFSAVAPDLPGFGESHLLNGPHTWEALVEWVDEFLDAAGLSPVHLAVHDWGGLIGLAWACEHPDRVQSLLITDTSFRSADRWHAMAQQWRTPGVGEELIGGMTEEGFRSLLQAAGDIPEDAISEFWKGLSTPARRNSMLEMYRSLDFEMLAPLEPKLPEVAPGRVRMIWGENDPFVPPKVGHRLGQILGSQVTVLTGAGHFLQEDAGEELGRLHLEFLRSF